MLPLIEREMSSVCFTTSDWIKMTERSDSIIKNAEIYLNKCYYSQKNAVHLVDEVNPKFMIGRGFKNALYQDYSSEADIRPYWDRARGHQLISLYSAYLQTSNEKYLDRLDDELNSITNYDDYFCNYLWTDALNLAIRSLNLLSLLEIQNTNSSNFDQRSMLGYLMCCECIIHTRSPSSSIENNHHLVETLTLIVYFKLTNQKKLLTREFRYLKRLRKTLFYDNGLLYEGSLPYQRFVLEAYLVCYYFLQKFDSDRIILEEIFEQIAEIYNYAINISGRSGLLKAFGDYDYGQVIRLSIEQYFTLGEIEYLYHTLEGKKQIDLPLLAIYDQATKQSHDNKKCIKSSPSYINSIGYSRISRGPFDVWIDNDYAGLGKSGVGGHGHNDTSSVIVDFNGAEIISDYGVRGYFHGPRVRDKDRSSFNHNLVSREGVEQNLLAGSYYIFPQVKNIDVWHNEEGDFSLFKVSFTVEYNDAHVLQRRVIKLTNKILSVRDISVSRKCIKFQNNLLLNLDKFNSSIGWDGDSKLIFDGKPEFRSESLSQEILHQKGCYRRFTNTPKIRYFNDVFISQSTFTFTLS